MKENEVVIFWFRRDLRLSDNRGLNRALSSGFKVLPVFIFDSVILERLEKDDARITFICEALETINGKLKSSGSSLLAFHGPPERFFSELPPQFSIKAVYANLDYERYAVERDRKVGNILKSKGIPFHLFSDQLIMEPGTVLKQDGEPYTVFTPFSKRWLSLFKIDLTEEEPSEELPGNFVQHYGQIAEISQESAGFKRSETVVKPANLSHDTVRSYKSTRDYPALDGTTHLGPHLRFGTISIREVMRNTSGISQVFTSELIWREFFMHILHFFPHVEERSFRKKYDNIEWINSEENFERWRKGLTGYPIVDAGMRELSATGYMHNRVRMITASFLVRHLLCDWRWGEAWFASLLLDFELSSNNGNWQWAAGTGCDAAPWFRIFSPDAQQKKFDPDKQYIRKWVPEYDTPGYSPPIVNHSEARERALMVYRSVAG
ncbi:MAG: deoxyribodipyrimidine photo-lyase [Bacteroidales bacterium]